jgi:hypothetical protein
LIDIQNRCLGVIELPFTDTDDMEEWGMKWLGSGLAIGTAIYATGVWSVLWFLLIPAVVDIITSSMKVPYTRYVDDDDE